MRILKSFSIFTFVGFFGACINFILMPLLSHYLNPEDYGMTAIINAYVSLLSPIVGLVAYGIISVEYYKTRDPKEFASLFSSVQVIPILPTVFLTFFVFIFYHSINSLLELPSKQVWVGLVILFLSLFIIYIETLNSYLIIAKKTATYAFFTLARVLCEAMLTIWFVVLLRKGWEGRIFSWALTTL